MNRRLRDLSLSKKLTMLLTMTAAVGVLLAFAILAANDIRMTKNDTVDELSAFAQIASINSSAAVTFRDREAAEETLNALQVAPAIVSAHIYDKNGGLFASYVRRSEPARKTPGSTSGARQSQSDLASKDVDGRGHWWDTDTVLQLPIRVDNETVATLILKADLGPMWNKLLNELGFMALAIVVSFAAALVLTARFKHLISGPILRLTQTAATVSRDRNYAVRVAKESNDELGMLTDKFNEMLFEIQTRDTELRKNRDELEKSVQARTAELSHANERLRLAVEGSNLGLWDWDLRTGRIYLNECWGAILGEVRRESDTTMRTLVRHIHPKDRSAAWTAIAETLKGNRQRAELEGRIRTRSGDWRWIYGIGQVVERDATGKPLRMIGINNDVTDKKLSEDDLLKAKEAAVAASGAKSQFLANMSHEIRTPMNGVLGMTELLLTTELTAKQRRFVETVRGSGEALLAIINDVLDFSKIEAGKLELETIDFDVLRLVEDVTDLVADRARRKGIELMYRIADGVPTRLRGDPGRLRQILTNLVGNAIKFTPTGEVVVDVRREAHVPGHTNVVSDQGDASQSEPEAVDLRFTVTDTGIGIAPETRERLFQPFTQADGSMARKYGGTGLGLIISRQLVEMMGGQIGVESTVAQGSTFWFTLPLVAATKPAPALARNDVRNVRMLVAENNATKRGILEHHARAWGMRCDCAPDGREALALLRAAVDRKDPYKVAIIDMKMADMDGIDLARAAKADRAIAPVKLVMLTSASSAGETASARDSGIAAYLTNPVHEADLYDTVVGALGVVPADAPSVPDSGKPTHVGPLRTCRLLLAEDNPVNQEVALSMLEGLGYRIDVASDGRMAVEAWSREHHDVILMDCQMPEMDGFAATAAIRDLERVLNETSTERRIVRIVALTANAMGGDRERCLAAGMDDYLSKPFTRQQLCETIERWVPTPNKGMATEAPLPSAKRTMPGADLLAKRRAVLNPQALDAIRALDAGGARGVLKRVIGIYFDSAPNLLTSMRDAAIRGDPDQLRFAAHTLKSSSANLGASKLADLCKTLEMEAREAKTDNAQTLAADIEKEFERVQAALQEVDVPGGDGRKVAVQGD